MQNLSLSNKKTRYTVKSEGINVRIEGQVSVDDTQKVIDYNGPVYAVGDQTTWLGNFNFNQSNASVNLQQSKDSIADASQLVIDTVKGIETELITL